MTAAAAVEPREEESRFGHELWRRVREHLGEEILEAGMGAGELTGKLLSRGRVFGVDADRARVDAARERLAGSPGLELLVADVGRTLPIELAGRSFDTVLCRGVLETAADPDSALANFRCLLRPAGRLVLVVPARRALLDRGEQTVPRRYDRLELRRALQDAGFRLGGESRLDFLGLSSSSAIPGGLAALLTPFERLLGAPAGFSWVAVGVRP